MLIRKLQALENRHNDIQMFEVKKGADVKFQFKYTTGCPAALPTDASFNLTDAEVD
jgi:hypothetical protein